MASPAGKDGKEGGIVKATGVAVAAGVALGVLGFVKATNNSCKSKDSVTTTASDHEQDIDDSNLDEYQQAGTATSSTICSTSSDHVTSDIIDDAADVHVPVAASLMPPNGHLCIGAGYGDINATTDLHQSAHGKKVKEFDEEITSSVSDEGCAGSDRHPHNLMNNYNNGSRFNDDAVPQGSCKGNENNVENLINETDPDQTQKKPWYMSIFGDHSKHSNSTCSNPAKQNNIKSESSKLLESKDSMKSHTNTSCFSAGGDGGFYEIKKGDTLWAISCKHGVSLSSLKAANGLHGDRIYPGEKLVIPQA